MPRKPKVYSWDEFSRHYRKPEGVGRQAEAEQFITNLKPGTAMEYEIPEGLSQDSARSVLYAAAKNVGVKIAVTSRGVEEGIFLVGRHPEHEEVTA